MALLVALLAASRVGGQPLTDGTDIKVSRGGSDVECHVILPHVSPDTVVVTGIRVDVGVKIWVSLDAGQSWRSLGPLRADSVDPILACSPHVSGSRLLMTHLEDSGAVSVDYTELDATGLDSTTAYTHTTIQSPAVPPGSELVRGWDKDFVWVDRRPSGPYSQRVYCGYSDSESNGDPDLPLERVHVKYSTNHGASDSWSSRKSIDSAIGDTLIHVGLVLATAPDAARAYAAWSRREANEDQAAKGLWFRYSTDGGDNWIAPGGGAQIMSLQGFGRHSLPGKRMRTTVSPSMAVAGDGDVYVAFADKESGHSDTDVYILKSEDGGASWKVPGGSSVGYKRVNAGGAGGENQDQWFPWITWDDATASLAVVYYDSRDDTTVVHTYVSVSRNEGVDWTDLRVSDTPWDGDPPMSSFGDAWVGDYIGIAAAGGVAFPVWADDRGASHSYRLYTSPVLLGGVDPGSVTPAVGVGSSGSGVRFQVNWNTLVATDGADRLTVTPPGGTPIVRTVASGGTSHQVVVDSIACPGSGSTWTYAVESKKGAALSRTGNLVITVPEIVQASVVHSGVEALVDSIRVTVSWNTNVGTSAGSDVVQFHYASPSGNIITPVCASYSVSSGGTSHTAVCKITPCVAQQYFYYEVSSTLCVAVQSAVTASTRFKVTACLEP